MAKQTGKVPSKSKPKTKKQKKVAVGFVTNMKDRKKNA